MTKVKPNPLNVEVLVEKARYKNVVVLPVQHEKFPSLVIIENHLLRLNHLLENNTLHHKKLKLLLICC